MKMYTKFLAIVSFALLGVMFASFFPKTTVAATTYSVTYCNLDEATEANCNNQGNSNYGGPGAPVGNNPFQYSLYVVANTANSPPTTTLSGGGDWYLGGTINPNSYVFTPGGTTDTTLGSDGSYIQVNSCTPTQGILYQDGSSFNLSLQGFAGAQGSSQLVCSKVTPPPPGGSQSGTINITANLDTTDLSASEGLSPPNSAVTIGPIAFTLTSTDKQATISPETDQSDTSGFTTASTALTGQFLDIPYGSYKLCASDTDAPCLNFTLSIPTYNAILNGNAQAGAVNGFVGSGNGADSSATCESTVGQLGWIVCGVVKSVSDAETALEQDVIKPMLQTKVISFDATACNSNETSGCTYKVWSEIRIYGDIILVLALLAVVFGEAIGGGVIDAYTAKKVLPRLLVAAILINLSVYIIAILEDIFNVIGGGLFSLISAPFANAGVWHITIDGVVSGAGSIGLLALLGGGAGLTIWSLATGHSKVLTDALGMFAMFVGLPVVMAVIGVVVTIIFRQGILIFLLMVSPVAFALYVLPNTEQYFKKWWTLLFKTLAVYPIVTLVFAMANVTAVVVSTFGISPQWLGDLMSIVAMAAPLFLIPFAFKIAGGVLGTIHQAVNGLTNKTQARIMGDAKDPNSRQNKLRGRFGRSKATAKSDLYNNSSLGKSLQQGSGRIGRSFGKRASRAEQRVAILNAQLARDPALATIANDEHATIAGTTSSRAEAAKVVSDRIINQKIAKKAKDLRKARPDLTKAAALAQATSNINGDQQVQTDALNEGEAAARRWEATGLGYSKSAGIAAFQAAVADGTVFKSNKDQASAIMRLAGGKGDTVLRDRIMGQAYAGNKAAGRFDLSPTYGRYKDLLDKMADGQEIAPEEWKNAAVEGIRTTSNTQLANMKGAGWENATEAMGDQMAAYSKALDDSVPDTDQEIQRLATIHQRISVQNGQPVIDRAGLAADARVEVEQMAAKTKNIEGSSLYFPEASKAFLDENVSKPYDTLIETQKLRGDRFAAGQRLRVLSEIPQEDLPPARPTQNGRGQSQPPFAPAPGQVVAPGTVVTQVVQQGQPLPQTGTRATVQPTVTEFVQPVQSGQPQPPPPPGPLQWTGQPYPPPEAQLPPVVQTTTVRPTETEFVRPQSGQPQPPPGQTPTVVPTPTVLPPVVVTEQVSRQVGGPPYEPLPRDPYGRTSPGGAMARDVNQMNPRLGDPAFFDQANPPAPTHEDPPEGLQ